MQNVISHGGEPMLPASVVNVLPPDVVAAVEKYAVGAVEELRLKAGRQAWMVCDGRNIALDASVDRRTLETILTDLCGGSLYAYADNIREGFITLSDGVRVGVAGRASVEEGKTLAVRDILTLCFRIPHAVFVDTHSLVTLLRSFSLTRGLLLYAPPGGGKTTALSSLARALGAGEDPLRVVVVDSRGELAPMLKARGLCVDVLTGYPRRRGIEIAARTLSAQVILCDELCGVPEAQTVIETRGGGVPLVATAHAADLTGLLRRSDVRMLHEADVFGAYIRVDRRGDRLFDVTRREDCV